MAGKVLVGVAAAAAGAAIGYFGSRLLSSWLSSSQSEEHEVKCAASKSDDSKEDKCKQQSEDDVMNDVKHTAAASHANTSRPAGAVAPQPSLHEHLVEYYQQYVDIDAHQVEAVQKVLQHVIGAVKYQLRDLNSVTSVGLKVGDVVPFGSVTEQLQVIRPRCCDVMIPVMFASQCHAQQAFTGDRRIAGKFVIKVDDDGGSDCDVCDGEQHLVTVKLLSLLHVVIERAVQDVTGLQCVIEPVSQSPHCSDSAVSVAVYAADSGDCHITVRFVPFIIIGNHLLLPAADPAVTPQSDVHGKLWQQSYVRQEKWSIDRFDSSVTGHVIVLKLLKAIRLNHLEQFGAISSYHLKMLLFHVLEDLPECCDWCSSAVSERLIDLLTRLIQVLSDHQLPHYFDHNINILADVPLEMCNDLAKFLDKKFAHNDIASLLKRDY